MSEYQNHSIEAIDITILERISEEEIAAWMAAKAHTLQSPGLPLESLDIDLWHREGYSKSGYDTGFKIYAGGKHGRGATIAEAVREVREKLADNPASRAAEKRRQARAAIKEAEKLEKLAASLG